MSGPEDNENLIPKEESGTSCLDLDNTQIDVEKELKTCNYSLIGTADNGAAKISLLVKITEQIPEYGSTESLQKSFSESNLPNNTVNGPTEGNSVSDQVVKIIDSTSVHKISTEITVDSQLLSTNITDHLKLKKNDTPFFEEFAKDDSSSITENPVDPALSADQSEICAENTQEKMSADQCKIGAEKTQEKPQTIYNQNLESTQDFKDSVSKTSSDIILLENKECNLLESGELPPDTSVDEQQNQGAEKSQDLEDGEVFGDDDDGPLKADNSELPVCRFYIRNGCSWGNHCRFRHPNNKGNYVMFENKVLPVVSTPFPPVWPPFMSPAYPINLNNMDTDSYYSQDPMEVSKRAPLLPTPSLGGDISMTQMNYSQPVELDRSIPSPEKPIKSKPIVWQSRLYRGSPCSTTLPKSPSRARSLSVSPPRYAKHVRLEIGSTDMSSLACKPCLKRYRLPSPPRPSVARIRGPRTPSCSPPRRPSVKIRAVPKRQSRTTFLSSSTDSSESSSYKSTTESSDESSSSSESDRVHRSRRSRRIYRSLFKKQSSRIPAKSTSKSSARSGQIEWCSLRRQEPSTSSRTSRHITTSKKLKHSPRSPKKLSPRTPDRAPPRATTKAPRKPRIDGSNPGRREYLIMKLMEVEEQIANKKKKMNLR